MIYQSVLLVLALLSGVFCTPFDDDDLNDRSFSDQCKDNTKRTRGRQDYRDGRHGEDADNTFSCLSASFNSIFSSEERSRNRGYRTPCNNRARIRDLKEICDDEDGSLCYFRVSADATVLGITLAEATFVAADCIPNVCVADDFGEFDALIDVDLEAEVGNDFASLNVDTRVYCQAETADGRHHQRGRNKGMQTSFSFVIDDANLDISERRVSFRADETTLTFRCNRCPKYWEVDIDFKKDRNRRDEGGIDIDNDFEPRTVEQMLVYIDEVISSNPDFIESGCEINFDLVLGQEFIVCPEGSGSIQVKQDDGEYVRAVDFVSDANNFQADGEEATFDTVDGEVVITPTGPNSAFALAPLMSVVAAMCLSIAAQM